MFNRSAVIRPQLVTSAHLLLDFTVHHLTSSNFKIISALYDKLLVSSLGITQLFIYSSEGLHLYTINGTDKLFDAAWTPRGNIVYTIYNGNKVVVMSESGKVITTYTRMKGPKSLSISYDGIIYFADYKTGVYQSTDDGVSWSLVFNAILGWHCMQVIKVFTGHSDDFWTVMMNLDNSALLRVYTKDKRLSDVNVTWRDLNVPSTNGKQIFLPFSSLSYDGNMNIFLSDNRNKAIHVLSVTGQYHCQLLSSHHIMNEPIRLTVDKERQLLYVGQSEGVVAVFKLTYGEEDE